VKHLAEHDKEAANDEPHEGASEEDEKLLDPGIELGERVNPCDTGLASDP